MKIIVYTKQGPRCPPPLMRWSTDRKYLDLVPMWSCPDYHVMFVRQLRNWFRLVKYRCRSVMSIHADRCSLDISLKSVVYAREWVFFIFPGRVLSCSSAGKGDLATFDGQSNALIQGMFSDGSTFLGRVDLKQEFSSVEWPKHIKSEFRLLIKIGLTTELSHRVATMSFGVLGLHGGQAEIQCCTCCRELASSSSQSCVLSMVCC